MKKALDPKKEQLLKVIVKEYIHTATPVASLSLGEQYGLDSSASTLRNRMSDLETLGYLKQPHPSAGRVPTDLGYRHYVDLLMQKENLSTKEKRLIEKELDTGLHEIERMVEMAAKLVSEIGNCITLVLSPLQPSLVVESIQLVRISKDRILFVVVTESGLVLDRIVEMEVTKDRLEVLSRFLNQRLQGQTLTSIGPHLLHGIEDEMVEEHLSQILTLISEIVEAENQRRVLVEGTHHLLNQPEFQDLNKLKNTLDALSREERISKWLGKISTPNHLSISIGYENPLKDFQELSIISVPYEIRKNWIGTLALAGPTRMDYDRLVPLVQYAASVLSGRLQHLMT